MWVRNRKTFEERITELEKDNESLTGNNFDLDDKVKELQRDIERLSTLNELLLSTGHSKRDAEKKFNKLEQKLQEKIVVLREKVQKVKDLTKDLGLKNEAYVDLDIKYKGLLDTHSKQSTIVNEHINQKLLLEKRLSKATDATARVENERDNALSNILAREEELQQEK